MCLCIVLSLKISVNNRNLFPILHYVFEFKLFSINFPFLSFFVSKLCLRFREDLEKLNLHGYFERYFVAKQCLFRPQQQFMRVGGASGLNGFFLCYLAFNSLFDFGLLGSFVKLRSLFQDSFQKEERKKKHFVCCHLLVSYLFSLCLTPIRNRVP